MLVQSTPHINMESLKDVQWLFFDVFGTVVDCTSLPF